MSATRVYYCGLSKKVSYATLEECLDYGDRLPVEPRAYLCECGYWHLTRALSRGTQESRSIGRRSHVAGPVDACYECGGSLVVAGRACSCGDGFRLAA